MNAMKNSILDCVVLPVVGLVFMLGLVSKADADQLPTHVVDALQNREKNLQNSTFSWQVKLQQSAPDKSQEQVAAMQKAIKKQLPEQLRQGGIVDENIIHKQVEKAVRLAPTTMKGFSYSSNTTWKFERDGTQTLVTGVRELGNTKSSYIQYYDKDLGLIANTDTFITGAGHLRGDDPNVWKSHGDSVRYRSLFQDSLDLLPEHYVMLLGLNPLAMYGAKWNLTSTTPTTWVLQTQVSQNNFAPATIELTLSREYNGAPSKLTVQSKDQKIDFQAVHFRRVGVDWLADKATYSEKWLGYVATNQTWTLQSITPSKPIVVMLPPKRLVHDYRLLGPNLTIQGLGPTIDEQQKKSVIYYKWSGQFPSETELNRMYQQKNPGEAAPDSNQFGSSPVGLTTPLARANLVNSVLPFAGGLMCLAGGAWMLQHRRVK